MNIAALRVKNSLLAEQFDLHEGSVLPMAQTGFQLCEKGQTVYFPDTIKGTAPAPDQTKLNAISAGRLASLTGLEANELQGQTIASISEKLKWAIDPEWLLFRRVCGRVVQTDPAYDDLPQGKPQALPQLQPQHANGG